VQNRTNYVVDRVESWEEFVELIESEELDGWAFRGQRVASWPLYSALSRYLIRFAPDPAEWSEKERRGIRIFRRKAHQFVLDPSALAEDLRCLALMQHHGAPTRLLDFTKSPFVAAFFALQRATDDAAVWAINTPVLWRVSLRSESGTPIDRDEIDPRERGKFEEYYLPNEYPFVWTGEPHTMDTRLVAQSGTFVIPGVLDRPVEDIIREYPDAGNLLRKIVLPADRFRRRALQSLYRMNITNSSLFPDLEGLGRSIAYELEVVWKGYRTPPSGHAD